MSGFRLPKNISKTIFKLERNWAAIADFSHQAITCSHLTMETLEQMCERGSKLTIKTPKRQLWRLFGVFIINFEHISHLCSSVSIVNFKQVNACWVAYSITKCTPIYFLLLLHLNKNIRKLSSLTSLI